MFGNLNRARSQDCVSDLAFDRWLAGDLGDADETQLNEHVRECARCRERRDRLRAERERFAASALGSVTWIDAGGPARRRSRVRTAWTAAAGLALAAGALLSLTHSRPSSSGARVKGGQQLTFYVKRGEQVGPGASMRPLRPGDKLRFAYTTPTRKYLTILSLDGEQHASIYYPEQARAAPVEPGVDVLLASAVELDASVGPERIIGLFCDEPLPVAALRAELAAKRSGFVPPDGCSIDQQLVDKEQAAAP